MIENTCPHCFVVFDANKNEGSGNCPVCGQTLGAKPAPRASAPPKFEAKHLAFLRKVLGASAYVRDTQAGSEIVGSWNATQQAAFFADFAASQKG